MCQRIAWLLLICSTLLCTAEAQQSSEQKHRYVVVPPERVLMAIASQPECSIQFEQVRYLASIDGEGTTPGFVVRNNGSKPIRELTIGGSDWTMSWSEKSTKKLLMPGERAFEGSSNLEIVPLTEKLRDQLKLNGPMQTVLVVMVIEVKYADGTTYDARAAHEALQRYAENLIDLKANMK